MAGSEGVAEYQVAGIYLCANEMGQNLGMTMQGYERIGDVGGYIWCYHYVLADGSRNEQILAVTSPPSIPTAGQAWMD